MTQGRQEKIYAEASQWVRLSNQVIWGLGSLFVPTSIAALWLAVSTDKYKLSIAILSITIFLTWIAITRIYATSSQIARKALVKIEVEWELDDELCFYTHQNNEFNKVWNVKTLQLIMLLVLVLAWSSVLLNWL